MSTPPKQVRAPAVAALLCGLLAGCGNSAPPPEQVQQDQAAANKASAEYYKAHPPGPGGRPRR